jgi:putative heme-binding domain-containing protein
MANAPKANQAVPTDLNLLESLITYKDQKIRLPALKVAGRWKAGVFSDLISKQIKVAESKRERLIAMRAYEKIGKRAEVEQMANSETDNNIRGAACVVWAEKDLEAAAIPTVNLLVKLDDSNLAESIYSAYRRTEDGPKILANALKGKNIPEPIASAGLKMIQTSGRDLPELEKALRESGKINSIGMDMEPKEKDQLIQDAMATGNLYRGQILYRKKELLCTTCHRVNSMGGLSGPDLSTIGTFMTPPAILDAVLNPTNDIKQGFETVILTKNDGEIVSGLLDRKTDKATLIRMANSEIVAIPASEIANIDVSPVSLMPTGLTRNLHKDELKDLLAYLMSLGVN